ncbi:hypothetical protein [Azospirillum soli]|uniref:hypothetical protein n=1 Tax=Azospirillum soli TaxID=1304799 RepID=UPI001AE20F78|nr:hypothetical protein [Azospirillum soli]MBP2311503.1 hypothetical protein [Azospirillum soli]
MTEETIAILVAQRRELLRDLATLQIEARRCETAIDHVEATILLLSPEFEWSAADEAVRALDEVLFQPGEIPLLAADILRESDTALSTSDIINRILARKGIAKLTVAERRNVARRLHSVLSARANDGVVRKVGRTQGGGMGRPACTVWALVDV